MDKNSSLLRQKFLEKIGNVKSVFSDEKNQIIFEDKTEEEIQEKFLENFVDHVLTLTTNTTWNTFINANLLVAKTIGVSELEGILTDLNGKNVPSSEVDKIKVTR